MSAVSPSEDRQRKRLPPWMSMPGAPPKPDFGAFGTKMSQMVAARKALIEQIKQLQSSVRGDDQRNEFDDERKALRQRMGEIDAQRSEMRDLRVEKNEEIAKFRKKRQETAEKLRVLQSELGGFTTLKEIDAAIAYVMRKMETSGGGLAAEKRTVKRLQQLEEVKSLLLQLQPLTEAIQEAGDREVMLQQEHRELHERIGALNKQYETELHLKQTKEKDASVTFKERAAIYAQCDELRLQITELNKEMDAYRASHNDAVQKWEAWCTEAKEKYALKVEAERQERYKRDLERRNHSKLVEKLDRARRRRNPYEAEIRACETLTQYLVHKKRMLTREEEDRVKREAAAAFDPSKALPEGFVVLNEGKWTKNSKPATKASKKQPKQNSVPPSATAKKVDSTRVLQHPEEKVQLFHLIELEPPLTIAAIDTSVLEIKTKLKKYEEHITTGDLVISSESDGEDDVNEVNDEAAVAEAAPTRSEGEPQTGVASQ